MISETNHMGMCMNYFILLLLLGCCGSAPAGRDCGRGREREGRCCAGQGGRTAFQRETERERECCDVPGMIPSPWQEYPKFPRRDNGEECDA